MRKLADEDVELSRVLQDGLLRVAEWLKNRGIRVLAENGAVDDHQRIEVFQPEKHGSEVDLCVCIGGDGTLLHLNSLFQTAEHGVPPIASFAMGSLGFLTNFDLAEFEDCLERIVECSSQQSVPITLRMRLMCEVFLGSGHENSPTLVYQALNELVIDRGSSAYMSKLELWVDGELVTVIRADGLIIATPTGSTAYSMSAGGSIVAPTVPAFLITPICAHSLSLRPIVLPESSEIMIRIPETLRPNQLPSGNFDGRNHFTLSAGDFIKVRMAECPVPTIRFNAHNHEFFQSITSKLYWNSSSL